MAGGADLAEPCWAAWSRGATPTGPRRPGRCARSWAARATPAQIAGFVMALRTKGETVDEIAGLAETMLDFATPLEIGGHAVDVVGSGGRPGQHRQHLDDGRDRGRRRRGPRGQAREPGGLLGQRRRRRARGAGRRARRRARGPAAGRGRRRASPSSSPRSTTRPCATPGSCAASSASPRSSTSSARWPTRRSPPPRPSAWPTSGSPSSMAGVLARRGHQGLVVHGGDGLDELTTTSASTVWVHRDGAVVRTTLDPLDLGHRPGGARTTSSAATRSTTPRWCAPCWPAGPGPCATSCC